MSLIKNHVFEALQEKRFFKLVCGASLTDTKMIEDLSFIFTLAGAHVIDLAPTADIILAARRGIEKALSFQSSVLSPQHSVPSPLVMASIQLDKDPHFRKVEVDYNLCDLCGACIKVCPTEAFFMPQTSCGFHLQVISTGSDLLNKSDKSFKSQRDGNSSLIYLNERCYGCGICPSYCHVNALKMIDTKPTPKETLKEMISLGIKSIEFHFGENYNKIDEIWDEIKDLVKDLELLSFSIGSGLLSNKDIKKAANLCYRLAGSGIILQCDGTPMSGGIKHKGNNTDNLSFEVAKIIQGENLPVYLQISGGTNQNSFLRAIETGLNINGVAIGSYARKILMPYLNKLDDNLKLEEAIKTARELVLSTGNIEQSDALNIRRFDGSPGKSDLCV